MYVNKRIDPSTWSIRHVNQNLSVLTIQLAIGVVNIYNVYNPGHWRPGQSVLPALDQAIREASSHHHIIAGDFNLHHPMWDHKERPHQDIGADALIELIEDHDLQLLTPEGAITFDNRAGSTGGQTTLDLTWATPDITDQLVSCVVQDDWRFVADHTPVATRFNLSPQATPKVECWQWRDADWE
jgi:exonuclease III